MKRNANSEDLAEAIKGAGISAKRKAFRNHLPYAILKDGEVLLVYPDKHTEIATPQRLEELHLITA
jgi:hypothetical protein